MTETVRYSLDELRTLRDDFDDILDHLDAHPFRDGAMVGPFERKTDLRQTGFTLHVRFGKGVKLPILPPTGGTRCVSNLAAIGFQPAFVSQLLNQLIETLERPL